MLLQYVKHKDIDFEKWDMALQNSANKLIYAESVYLNTICGKWDALISEHYDCIMPLPIKTKIGIAYIPTVPFIQQLGIFSKHPVTEAIQKKFEEFIQKKIKLADYDFNYANTASQGVKKINYILALQHPYPAIYNNYKNDLKKDLKKLHPSIVSIQTDFDITKSIQFFKNQIGSKIPHVQAAQYQKLIQLCTHYKNENRVISMAVTGKEKLYATAVFLKDENRIYNIASAISPEGKKIKANHFLFDNLIQEYAGTDYCLDFEGSDIIGIGNFYLQFGTQNQPYFHYHFNRLPAPLKWLKS